MGLLGRALWAIGLFTDFTAMASPFEAMEALDCLQTPTFESQMAGAQEQTPLGILGWVAMECTDGARPRAGPALTDQNCKVIVLSAALL